MDVSDLEFAFVEDFLDAPANDKFSEIFRNLSDIMSSLEVSPRSSLEGSSNDHGENDRRTSYRKPPSRLAKENFLHRSKKGGISKPKTKDRINMSPKFIQKLYIENKPRNFRPASLETIYEEPIAINNEVRLIGNKKLKRSLSCCDGINISKTTKKVRKLRIKQAFGRKAVHKKISLEDFIQRLNANLDGHQTDCDKNSENLGNTNTTISAQKQDLVRE